MNHIKIAGGLLLTLLAALNLNAQNLYTWTDENGVVHIADQPPSARDRVEDVEVMRYEKKTPQEIAEIQHKKENLRRQLDRAERIEKARQTEIQARVAAEKAQKAAQQAQEEYEYNNEYIRRLTSTRHKRKKFRKRVERIKTETETSQAEAKAALVRAQEESQKAGKAVEEAQKDPGN